MHELKVLKRNVVPTITKFSRRPSSRAKKIRPMVENEALPPTNTITNTRLQDSSPVISSDSITSNQPIQGKNESDDDPPQVTSSASLNKTSLAPSLNNHIDNTKEMKNSNRSRKDCFRRLTPNQKKLLKIIIVSLLIVAALTAAIIPPVYVFVIRPAPSESLVSFANLSASVCFSSTCIGQETSYRSSIVTFLFTFGGHNSDQTGYVPAFIMGPTATMYAQSYLTDGLLFSLTPQQYLQTLYINLVRKTFTVELWLFIQSYATSNDFGLFGQCDAYNVCLSISLRNGRVAISLDSMHSNSTMLIGSTVITLNAFTHVTVVYDRTFSQLRIYVNGRIDAISTGMVSSYQASSENLVTTIARSSSFGYSNSYFIGRLDHLTISSGTARSACQILNDASLVVYYPFSNTDPYSDYSVNLCHGIASRTSIISTGHIGQAISFSSSSSYFQAQCFPRMRNGDDAYSISMWINPTSNTGGSVLHLSALWSGNGTCYDLLGLTASGHIVLQWIMSATNVNSSQGPVLLANKWVHVAVVHQFSNGIRLYINGQLSGSSSTTGNLNLYELGTAPLPWYMTFGNTSPLGSPAATNCLSSSSIVPGAFSGAIDEFRLYNRELDYQELCVLSNP